MVKRARRERPRGYTAKLRLNTAEKTPRLLSTVNTMPHFFEEGNARAEHITGVVAGKFPTVSLTNGFNLYVPPPSYYLASIYSVALFQRADPAGGHS